MYLIEIYVERGLVLTDLGEDCLDRGLQPIDKKECIYATDFIQTHYPQYEFSFKAESTSKYPKGCYVFVGKDDYRGYFNTHLSGSAESRSRVICKNKRGMFYVIKHDYSILF